MLLNEIRLDWSQLFLLVFQCMYIDFIAGSGSRTEPPTKGEKGELSVGLVLDVHQLGQIHNILLKLAICKMKNTSIIKRGKWKINKACSSMETNNTMNLTVISFL